MFCNKCHIDVIGCIHSLSDVSHTGCDHQTNVLLVQLCDLKVLENVGWCWCCFRVPAYYALILRSLTVLEGLALQADPGYKLLGRAYPYIARRLLTDPAPQLRQSFEELVIKVRHGAMVCHSMFSVLLTLDEPVVGGVLCGVLLRLLGTTVLGAAEVYKL